MKIGLLGLPGSGKSTVFRAVTGKEQQSHHGEDIAVVRVPDTRLDFLADMYNPKKKTPPEITFVDLTALSQGEDMSSRSNRLKQVAGDADAFTLVVQGFGEMDCSGGELDPKSDLEVLLLELTFTDLDLIDRRIARITDSGSRSKKDDTQKELELLHRCHNHLEAGRLMRDMELTTEEAKSLRGFAFLTNLPMVVVFNIDEDDLEGAKVQAAVEYAESMGLNHVTFCATVEEEIAQLPPEEQREFLADYGLTESARDRLIKAAYDSLAVITFFTSGPDECRGWTIRQGTNAQGAAGKIHTDLADNFVRAEVIHFADMEKCGSEAECRKQGVWGLQGADYPVQDGDIIVIRFTH